MCIIVAKPAGIDMPTHATIKRCFDRNRDGAGFMLLRKKADHILIDKGFMSLHAFKKALKKVEPSTDDIVVMHFRITTSGGTCTEMCHPFPISSDRKVIRKLIGRFEGTCFAHNGIISELNGNEKDMSDTAIFSRDYLSDEAVYGSIYESPAMQSLLMKYVGHSKLSFLNPDKGLLLLGNFIKSDGVYYSNDGFKPPVATTHYGSGSYSGNGGNFQGTQSDTTSTSETEWVRCGRCQEYNHCLFVKSENDSYCEDCIDITDTELSEPNVGANDQLLCDSCREACDTVSHINSYDTWICNKCFEVWEKDGFINLDMVDGIESTEPKYDNGLGFCMKENCTLQNPCDDCEAYAKNLVKDAGKKKKKRGGGKKKKVTYQDYAKSGSSLTWKQYKKKHTNKNKGTTNRQISERRRK